MEFTYDDTQTIRVSELKLLTLDEAQKIIAQVNNPTQALEMAKIHSDEAIDWVLSVITECNRIHNNLKGEHNDQTS